MISLNYSKDIVLFLALDLTGNTNPTADDLKAVDSDLRDTFEEIVLEIMPEFGIETKKDLKSRIILYSKASSGGSTRNRVRNACRYFVSTHDL